MDFKLKDKLVARDVRNLELELAELPDRLLSRASFSHHEMILKAAIAAGWIEEPETKKRQIVENGETFAEYLWDGQLIDDMEPQIVYGAGHVIEKMYKGFTQLDPN